METNMDRRSALRALAAPGLGGLAGVGRATGERLRLGLTAVILADQVAFLSRWSRYLSEQAQCEISFVARESYQTILELLFAGDLDAAWICGYPYVRYQADLELLAVPLYQGTPLYQAYLIGSNASQVRGWADLRGKVLAYSDPLSNSGWLVAQTQLAQVGLGARDLKRAFFAHGHRNVAEAVAARLAQAGAIDGYVWETMRLQGMAAVARTEVVWKSAEFGFPPLVVRHGQMGAPAVRLQKALLAMAGNRAGGDLLKALNLTGFIAGTPSLFDSIRQQARRVPGSGMVA
jgi:phosphonate transport system substrate-binding protein